MGFALKACPVVTVEIYVQRAQQHGVPKALLKQGGQSAGDISSAPFDTHQHDMVAPGVALHNLGRQAFQHTRHFVLLKQQGCVHVSSRGICLAKPYRFL